MFGKLKNVVGGRTKVEHKVKLKTSGISNLPTAQKKMPPLQVASPFSTHLCAKPHQLGFIGQSAFPSPLYLHTNAK